MAKDDGVAAPVRVVVADDDVLLREGLASLLERSGFDVVGQAGDGAQLLALVRDTTPDLVVADIRMPPTNTTEGLDAARVIREELPDIAILVLSAHVEVEHAMELLASGHSIGYLLKSRVTDVADFIDTLERIAKGASVVDPALVQELVSARRRDDPLAALSAREREVLALMAEGRSNAGIAHRLWVTEGTVEKHVRSILTQAESAGDRRRSPPGASGDHLPRGALTLPNEIADGAARQGGLGHETRRPGWSRSCRRSPARRGWRSVSRVTVSAPPPGGVARRVRSRSRPPRSMSTSVTSGRNSSKRRSASALVDATPTTVMPWRSSRPRAASTKSALSSTIRQRMASTRSTMRSASRSAGALEHSANWNSCCTAAQHWQLAGRHRFLLAGGH